MEYQGAYWDLVWIKVRVSCAVPLFAEPWQVGSLEAANDLGILLAIITAGVREIGLSNAVQV